MAAKKKATPKTPAAPRKSQKERDKEKLAGINAEAVLGRAMLVNVCIGNWDGRKHDSEVTAEVNKQRHASAEAGRYHKHLFGGKVKELSQIITAATMLRHAHYANTLPWTDSGWRMLPTANYTQYTDIIRAAIRRYYDAVEAFMPVYPRLIKEAKEKLNGMFRAEDYPTADELRTKFHAEIDFSPIAAGTDFRVTLPAAELKAMAKNVEERLKESIGKAVDDAWQRLGDAVHELRGKLDDGKYLRDTLIERVRDVADTLGRLNLLDDATFESTRSRVLRELTLFSAEQLKTDEKVRKTAADNADDILKSMAGIYSPPADTDDK